VQAGPGVVRQVEPRGAEADPRLAPVDAVDRHAIASDAAAAPERGASRRCSQREIECMRWAAAGKTSWETVVRQVEPRGAEADPRLAPVDAVDRHAIAVDEPEGLRLLQGGVPPLRRGGRAGARRVAAMLATRDRVHVPD
jgi:hypothetical protein